MDYLDRKNHVDSEAFQIAKSRIFTDITQQLYQAANPGIIANTVLGLILIWTLWGTVPDHTALYWLGANLTVNSIRLFLTRYVVKERAINEDNWNLWSTTHVATSGAISAVWGSAAFLFYVQEQIEFQVFFTLIVAGMSAAAFPLVAIYLPSYLAYLLPTMIPLLGVFLIDGGRLHEQMALLVVIYVLTMWATARQYYLRIIDSTRLRMQFEQLALVDALTGLSNRRAFDNRLDEEWRRMMRTQRQLTLMVIDIDNFKEYNDGYGHQAGDECLQQIAKTINRELRRSGDFVARLGGEEFVALIPDIDKENALLLAEQTREAVYALEITHPNPSRENVSISIGLSTTIPNQDHKPSDFYKTADDALYAAKNTGRNRVCVRNL